MSLRQKKLDIMLAAGRSPKELSPRARRNYAEAIGERHGAVAAALAVVDADPRLPVGLTSCERCGLAGLCGLTCPAYGSEVDCPTEE